MLSDEKRLCLSGAYDGKVIDRFYEELIRNNIEVRTEIARFEQEEVKIYNQLSKNLFLCTNSNIFRSYDTKNEISTIEMFNLGEKTNQHRLSSQSIENKLKKRCSCLDTHNNERPVEVSMSQYQTPIIYTEAEDISQSTKTINLHTNKEQKFSFTNNPLCSYNENLNANFLSVYAQSHKRQYLTRTSYSRNDIIISKRDSAPRSRRTSKLTYGELPSNNDVYEVAALKRDISQQKEEIDMLNREVMVLCKEVDREANHIDILSNTCRCKIIDCEDYTTAQTRRLNKKAGDGDKRIGYQSDIDEDCILRDSHSKAINVMRIGFDNLIREKQLLKQQLSIANTANGILLGELALLKDKIDTKEKEYRELDTINQKLSENFAATA